jgi:hypothetical protein
MYHIGSRIKYQGDAGEVIGVEERNVIEGGYYTPYVQYTVIINGRTVEVLEYELEPLAGACICDMRRLLSRGCDCGAMERERNAEAT